MATTLKSKIILCNGIKLDRNYTNVLSYSENDMLTLCQNNMVSYNDDYSFIRENGSILVEVPYSTCLTCNYMAYQNKDYSNKWFFAFIDKVEYVSNKSTRVYFTIDAWSTWFDVWTLNRVFVHKEHTLTDNFGENTLPENLETGEYINVETPVSTAIGSDISICVATSKHITQESGTYDFTVSTPNGRLVNGIYQGLEFAIFSDYPNWASGQKLKEDAVNLYMYLFGNTTGVSNNDIIDIFMIPTAIIGSNYNEVVYQTDDGTLPFKVKFLTSTSSDVLLETYLLKDNKNLAGSYVPHNNKLLCYPYRYLLASNGTGQDVVYKWEDFVHSNTDHITFKTNGDLTPNCSIKLIPQNYKGIVNNIEESLNYSKYPTCSWIYDAYTNWMTQNNVNNAFRTIGGLVKVGLGASSLIGGIKGGVDAVSSESYVDYQSSMSDISSGGSSIGGGLRTIASVAMEQYQHQFDANQSRGNINAGDINFSITKNEIQFYKMSIKPEYARIIDGIFNRFGYTVNRFKLPNTIGRKYWNYVEVTNGERTVEGNIPQIYLDIINKAFINGVTIWHNHSNIGNFELVNDIAPIE